MIFIDTLRVTKNQKITKNFPWLVKSLYKLHKHGEAVVASYIEIPEYLVKLNTFKKSQHKKISIEKSLRKFNKQLNKIKQIIVIKQKKELKKIHKIWQQRQQGFQIINEVKQELDQALVSKDLDTFLQSKVTWNQKIQRVESLIVPLQQHIVGDYKNFIQTIYWLKALLRYHEQQLKQGRKINELAICQLQFESFCQRLQLK